MKILHCCLSNFYIDNYNYQENVLPRQNKIDGHEVMILASTETFINNNKYGYLEPSKYINEDGITVVRIPYSQLIFNKIKRKIRSYKSSLSYINEFQPDIIFFHGVAAFEILKIANYKANNPNIKLYVDSHQDFNNSARNFISKNILHRLFYKRTLKRALPNIDKVFYISEECYDFLKDFYEVPENKLEFFPLGGTIFNDHEYTKRRDRKRRELGLGDSDILYVHSGKMNKLKRTSEILKAFIKVKSENAKLVLIGSIPEVMEDELTPLIDEDKRIKYLGWKKSEELLDYLCAADMYLQPGSQSATMQNAICCKCPVMLYPHKSHKPFLKHNGFYVQTEEDIKEVFNKINDNPNILEDFKKNSEIIANDLLDYKKLASRLYK